MPRQYYKRSEVRQKTGELFRVVKEKVYKELVANKVKGYWMERVEIDRELEEDKD